MIFFVDLNFNFLFEAPCGVYQFEAPSSIFPPLIIELFRSFFPLWVFSLFDVTITPDYLPSRIFLNVEADLFSIFLFPPCSCSWSPPVSSSTIELMWGVNKDSVFFMVLFFVDRMMLRSLSAKGFILLYLFVYSNWLDLIFGSILERFLLRRPSFASSS